MIPDKETQDRIKNLAIVGTAVLERSNEGKYETNYYAAKEALTKFKDGINKLELDEESKQGISDLVKYLDEKITKRLNAASI